jgi:hypothetical protein
LLRTTASSPGDDIRGEQRIVAERSNRERSERGWLAPVKTRAFYDGDTRSHKARREK